MATEPFAQRWRRRAKTIPAVLGATLVATIALPLLGPATVVLDLTQRRWRLPTLRTYLFVLQYLLNDSVEVVLAPLYWVAAGFGTRIDSVASQRRHQQLQRWSIEILARRAEALLGLRFALDNNADAALGSGPAIVLCRHVNIVDASLPALLYHRRGLRVRGVIMAELLADPGFDLLYGRLGSAFIPRDDSYTARAAISQLARGLDHTTVAVIFPEGRLYRPDRLERSLARMAATHGDRAERLSTLRHVLPPHVGGVHALLDAAPIADVVVIAHAGLDRFSSFADLARTAPLRDPIAVTAWRVPRCEIPEGRDARAVWLDQQWVMVDTWIDQQLTR